MGNCFKKLKKASSVVVPYDFSKPTITVRLHGSPDSPSTGYIRFALRYKNVSTRFIPSENYVPVLRIGSETTSDTREMMLRFIEARFPHPPLLLGRRHASSGSSLLVRAMVLQHRSMTRHLERLVRWGQILAARGGRGAIDPQMGTPRMELRKFGRSYSMLVELMVEHAQVEEQLVFPFLEMADRGICKGANEDHARNLPLMNGIKEDIKSIGVMESGCLDYQEALYNLSARLKSLQAHCIKQFEREERNILPLMEAVELTYEQHLRLLEQCFLIMQETHSHLFNFLFEGLLPSEGMQYMDVVIMSRDIDLVVSMFNRFIEE